MIASVPSAAPPAAPRRLEPILATINLNRSRAAGSLKNRTLPQRHEESFGASGSSFRVADRSDLTSPPFERSGLAFSYGHGFA